MDEIHSFCQAHGLTYYLCGGSALGALRHGGFIPWDDDIDIVMPRPDFERFIKLCRAGEFSNTYFLHHTSTDAAYAHSFAKVRKNNTHFPEKGQDEISVHTGIFIDIFPLDYTRNPNSKLHHLRGYLIEQSKKLINRKLHGTLPNSFFGKIIYWLTQCVSIRGLVGIRERLANIHSSGGYFTSFGGVYNYQRDTFPTGVFGTPQPLPFENRTYLFPERCEEYLETLYGNWRQLPPPEARHWHCTGEIIFDTRAPQH